jgi:hypothetical protein
VLVNCFATQEVVWLKWTPPPPTHTHTHTHTHTTTHTYARALTPFAGLKKIAALQPHLFEGSHVSECVAAAAALEAADDRLRPGSGAWSTVRRGSVRPLSGSDAGIGSSSGDASRGGVTSPGSVAHSAYRSGSLRPPRPAGGMSLSSPGSRALSVAPSCSTAGASTIGGAPMSLLAGGTSAAVVPGASFSRSRRF